MLKAIRRRRSLSARDVAARMGLPLRTYQHFEGGHAGLDVARVHRFAEAVDADAYAILAALDIGSPAFALRCIDNKAMTILMMAVQDFDAAIGADLARLEPRTLIAAFTRAFDGLAAQAREIDAFVESWMTDKSLHAGPVPDDDAD